MPSCPKHRRLCPTRSNNCAYHPPQKKTARRNKTLLRAAGSTFTTSLRLYAGGILFIVVQNRVAFELTRRLAWHCVLCQPVAVGKDRIDRVVIHAVLHERVEEVVRLFDRQAFARTRI